MGTVDKVRSYKARLKSKDWTCKKSLPFVICGGKYAKGKQTTKKKRRKN